MKIVIRAPNWLGDIIMSFPFLHALYEAHADDDNLEIHVIIKSEYLQLLNFLPFSVKPIPFNKTDHSELHGIFKFCYHCSELQHSDKYYCLPPSFSSALMGKCLKAKKRIGYSGQLRNFLLTHKTKPPENIHRSQEYLRLLSLDNKKDHSLYRKVMFKGLNPFYEDSSESRYIVINPNSEASSRRLPLEKWVELLNLFIGQRFVVIGAKKDRERVSDLLSQVSDRNTYTNMSGNTDIIELSQILAFGQGFITNDSGPAHLASYLGTKVSVFFGPGDPNNTAPTYNAADVLVIRNNVSCSPCLKNSCPKETLECLVTINMEKVFEQICEFFYVSK